MVTTNWTNGLLHDYPQTKNRSVTLSIAVIINKTVINPAQNVPDRTLQNSIVSDNVIKGTLKATETRTISR